MLTLDDLLGRNYLPAELPPAFVSTTLGQHAADLKRAWSAPKREPSRPVRFNLARHGSLRRQLGIPNPVHQLSIADLICTRWSDIDQKLAHAPSLSLSRPSLNEPAGGARSFGPRFLMDVQADRRAQIRAGMRFSLRADIARFYPSIYTHSIEWAIHGKAASKTALSSRQSPGWGTDLDTAIRRAQDQETMGIPIGPYTSAIIAELVLSAIDASLDATMPPGTLRGFRYVDDYELTFARRETAEEVLHALQAQLGEFNLHLNALKTGIIALPTNLDSPWSAHLRGMFFRPRVRDERRDLLRLFDIAVELAARYPDQQVQKYALGILRKGVTVSAANWPMVQGWLLQCLVAEPGTARDVLKELLRYDRIGSSHSVKRDILSESLQRLIQVHIPQGHSSEVAWGLWGMIEFKLPIDVDTARAVVAMDDPIVALLALACHHEFGIWPAAVDFTPYHQFMTHDQLYGERWILAYEAMKQGWLQPSTSNDALTNDPYFKEMANRGVTFFDAFRPLGVDAGPESPFWLGSSGGP